MDEVPWADSAHSYAGWIPNVGSHLSFSMIGENKGPRVARFSQPFDGRIGRFVAAIQDRPTDDFLVSPGIARHRRPGIVQQWLVVGATVPVKVANGLSFEDADPQIGEDDEQGMLSGTINAISHEPRAMERQIQEWGVAEIRGMLQAAQARFMRGSSLKDAELAALEFDLARVVRWRAPSASSIRFALMRTGELRLWYADAVVIDASEAARRNTIARQAYFFLKDMVHHHTHHDSSSDQITPLVQVNAREPDRRLSGERKWRRETAWSLSRTVENLVRTGSLDDKRQALGILAYADAFQRTLLNHSRDHDDPRRFVAGDPIYGFDFAHIRESLKVQIDRAQVRRSHFTAMLVAGLASSIAALSLLSSLISTHNNFVRTLSPPGRTVELEVPLALISLFAAYPIAAIAVVFVAVTVISTLVTDGGAPLLRRGPRRFAQGLRGATLTVTNLLGRDAAFAHRLIVLAYVTIISGLFYALAHLPRLVHEALAG
jgi:hypothetical protein